MQIDKTIKNQRTGKDVTVSLSIEGAKVSGTATTNGTTYIVTGAAVIQNAKVLSVKGGYIAIPSDLYAEITATCKAQFAATMTPEQIAEGKMREAERKYNQLFAAGWNNIAIIEARNEWDRLSREYNDIRK